MSQQTTTPARRRALAASMVGSSIEFYDFYIYATAAALVFGTVFFPSSSPSAQLMAAYASAAVAFIARPVGAILFGHFGDRVGRKTTLVAALLLMGGSTIAIGFLPTYATVGWIAPLLLCLLRLGQGLALGGEWGGAVLLAVENAPPGYRARYGMWPQFGAPVGFVLANGLFLILGIFLTPEDFIAWGWRLPFLASVVLVAVGLWVRLTLVETPAFVAARAAAPPPKVPAAEVLRKHGLVLLGAIFGIVAVQAVFYIATVFLTGYGTTVLHYSRVDFLGLQLAAIPLFAIGIYIGALLADRFSTHRVLSLGIVLVILAGFLLAPTFLSGSPLLLWAYLALSNFLAGITYGPLGAWLPALFPTRVRYTGTSLAFGIGSILGGGLTPIAAQGLVETSGLSGVGIYLSAVGAMSLIALLFLRRPAAAAAAA
jgi:MFS family permease